MGRVAVRYLRNLKIERKTKMLKSIIKAVATPERLSGYAADGIQKGVNGTKEETAATVAKYATITNEMAELTKNISAMLTDGRIDKMERDTLQKMLEPLFAKVMELV